VACHSATVRLGRLAMTYAASSVFHWDGDDEMQIQEDGTFVEQ
jgi:hypothetical protein